MSVFTDGFENNFASWTGIVGTPSIVNTPVHHGTKAMCAWINGTAANYAYKILDKDYPHLFVRLYFQIDALKDAPGRYFKVITLRDASGTVRAQVGIAAQGSGVYMWEFWTELAMRYTEAIVPNRWYCIEIEFDGATGVNNRLYRDGELIITNWSPTASIREVDVGATEVSHWYANLYLDCVAVSETYNGPEVGPTLVTITYSSSPITVSATIDGQIIPSGGKIEVPVNSTITVTVPQEVTA
jgi:hypothetical protein